MELIGKRILLISPEPWEGLHMSKHHLSQALAARGNEVVFLDPPASEQRSISTHRFGEVTVVRYKHWLRGVNRLPIPVNRWYYRSLIDRVAHRSGGPFDIIWNFDTSRMQSFPNGSEFKLLHLADYDILYQGQGLIPSADLIFTTCQVVADEVAPKTKARTVNMGHALDERWLSGTADLVHRPISDPRRVVFMGQLANTYNDWEGFEETARSHPSMEFTFIGPFIEGFAEPAFQRLKELPNVEFTGLKPKQELIPMVRSADILWYGFRSAARAKERANPHKVLEYLSTGNVIVGSYTMEYEKRGDLFTMAAQGGSLNAAFDLALLNFAELNAHERRSERIRFAQERSMPNLIHRMEQEIER